MRYDFVGTFYYMLWFLIGMLICRQPAPRNSTSYLLRMGLRLGTISICHASPRWDGYFVYVCTKCMYKIDRLVFTSATTVLFLTPRVLVLSHCRPNISVVVADKVRTRRVAVSKTNEKQKLFPRKACRTRINQSVDDDKRKVHHNAHIASVQRTTGS